MNLTIETAKELSERKWQIIVDSNANLSKLKELLPEVTEMLNDCAMCEYHLHELGKRCNSCIYASVCSEDLYEAWVTYRSKSAAADILREIKRINEIHERSAGLKTP